MLNTTLLELVRCPRCLARVIGQGQKDDGTSGCLRPVMGQFVCSTCNSIYAAVANSPTLEEVQAGEDIGAPEELPAVPADDLDLLPRRGYLDLMPRDTFEHNTRYLEEEFEHQIDHQHISLPLLGAAVRNDLLKKMLKPRKNEIALEVGCGNGKFCYWNRSLFGTVVGVDAAPLFAEEVLDEVPMVRGDGRLLPFASASFDKIFTIDVLEHLSLDGIAPFFAELNRVLKPGGQVFIFSNTREMGKLALIMKFERRIAAYFARRGIFDFKRDELRKSDHIKALRTFEELVAAVNQGGFRLEKKVFWNGVFQGLIDNIIIKSAEYFLRRRVQKRIEAQAKRMKDANQSVKSRLSAGTIGITADWADGGMPRLYEAEKAAESKSTIEREAEKVAKDAEKTAAIDLAIRKSLKSSMSSRKGGGYLVVLRFLTLLMKLDILFFGRMQTGPYFIVIRKS